MAGPAAEFLQPFVTVLVITDPVGSIPTFLALTEEFSVSERRRSAGQAALVAAGVILGFAAFGQAILALLGIGLAALRTAGGLLLALVALELLEPARSRDGQPRRDRSANPAMVPLGTPLLAGPGAIATTMYYIHQARGVIELSVVVAALAAVAAVIFVTLRFAAAIGRLLGRNGVSVLTRIFGLLVVAIAVQMVAGGVAGLVASGGR